jgi:hypothetical protein
MTPLERLPWSRRHEKRLPAGALEASADGREPTPLLFRSGLPNGQLPNVSSGRQGFDVD